MTSLISFAVSLLGFKAVHLYERWSWIPNLISLVIAVGCGGHHLRNQAPAAPATAPQVFSYGCLIAGYFITFGGTSSDYSIYHDPRKVSKYVPHSFPLPTPPPPLTNPLPSPEPKSSS